MVSMVKYFTYTVNLIFVVTGIYSAVLGGLYFYFYYGFSDFTKEIVWIVPLLMLCLGGAMILLGLFGCCGLPMRVKTVAVIFYLLANIIIFTEIGLGVFWGMMWENYESYLDTPFDMAFANHADVNEHTAWIKIQTELECCGVEGPKDFLTTLGGIPRECCPSLPSQYTASNITCTLQNAVTVGCKRVLLDKMKTDAYVIIASTILSGLIKLAVLLLSFVIKFDEIIPEEYHRTAGSAYYFSSDDSNRD